MINADHHYSHAGTKSAEAHHERDISRARHWSDWARRAISMEKHAHGQERADHCEKLYRDAYRAEASSYTRF